MAFSLGHFLDPRPHFSRVGICRVTCDLEDLSFNRNINQYTASMAIGILSPHAMQLLANAIFQVELISDEFLPNVSPNHGECARSFGSAELLIRKYLNAKIDWEPAGLSG